MTFPRRPTIDRFNEKWVGDCNAGCWLWVGTTDKKGYGRIWNGDLKVLAHRFAYEAFNGPIPEGLTIDHLCRVPSCVNPAHLEAVTHRENVLRGIGPCAVHAKKTHCIHGHPFDEANTYYTRFGRACRECTRQKNAECIQRHPEKLRANQARYRERHRERINTDQNRRYHEKKAEKENANG